MTPSRGTFVGILLIALATLTYEILLTRIFSVTMWYHFAFVAISIAMFGMTVGALIVYLFPKWFPDEGVPHRLAICSLAFGATALLALFAHLRMIPFVAQRSLLGVFSLAVTFAVISVPFVFSGICVSVVLTRYPSRVGSLYAADLVGAALGCVTVIWALEVTDGPTVAVIVTAIACLAALAFSHGHGMSLVRRLSLAAFILLVAFTTVNTVLVQRQAGLMPLTWVKGRTEPRPLWESWNSHSRIAISGSPDRVRTPGGPNFSATMPSDLRASQLLLNIDASAATMITRYDGDVRDLEFLKYDITNLAHYLRREANVLVVGVGGGTDLLSAVAFDQRRVVGVELNQDILRVLTDVYADYSGNLATDPRITLINDEARAYVISHDSRFDIIQISFIDTWAATAAGAFVLSENTLYTIEGVEDFLQSLNSGGILSYTRWYNDETPGSMFRLTALATAALARLGVADPRDHIFVVTSEGDPTVSGVGTILISPDPFTERDRNTLDETAARLRFDVSLSPRTAVNETFASLATSEADMLRTTQGYAINIEPPTDESPFFFQLLRFRNIFQPEVWQQGRMTFNQQAVYILGALLVTVLLLTTCCIVLPLLLSRTQRPGLEAFPYLVFFAAIGLGFMLIEIAQMQRLNIFLGHPTYGLAVVLFTLLLAGGLGSELAQRVGQGRRGWLLWILLGVLIAAALLTPPLLAAFRGDSTTIRIVVAVILMAPMGLVMGMPFPTGMARAAGVHSRLTPWFWGINGATSVCGSVLAVTVSLFSSISTTYWMGFCCYGLAVITFAAVSREGVSARRPVHHIDAHQV